jgi:hypothetical protein
VTSTIRLFPDVARVLVDDLELLAGAGHTGGQTPADLVGMLPFIRVLRVGGGSDRLNDFPVVDVDVFAATYVAAQLLAEQVRARLVGPPPASPVLDSAVCQTGPHELPWGDGSTVRRFGATYIITARRRRLI